MRREARAFLWDVLEASQHVEAFVRGRTLADYQSDVQLRSAVERQLEIIGEALGQLSRVAPEMAEQVPDLRRIVGLRNILIHGYSVVNHETVWRAVHENLPDLRAAVDRLFGSGG